MHHRGNPQEIGVLTSTIPVKKKTKKKHETVDGHWDRELSGQEVDALGDVNCIVVFSLVDLCPHRLWSSHRQSKRCPLEPDFRKCPERLDEKAGFSKLTTGRDLF